MEIRVNDRLEIICECKNCQLMNLYVLADECGDCPLVELHKRFLEIDAAEIGY